MIDVLIDTSVWADHFRSTDDRVISLVESGRGWMHPFVLGELAMGNLVDRARTIAALAALPSAAVVPEPAWLDFVDRSAIGGTGIGFVDAHLLAAAEFQNLKLWTRDRRLAERAATIGRNWND